VGGELNKTHEEIRRGTLAELAGWAAAGVRGEVTLVVAGASGEQAAGTDLAAAAAEVAAMVAGGSSRRDAIAAVAAARGLSRRALYAVVVSPAGRAGSPDTGAGRTLDAGPDSPEETSWN
jgi:16S rRNA (cytidine1402-2'-O)-methyltransferase